MVGLLLFVLHCEQTKLYRPGPGEKCVKTKQDRPSANKTFSTRDPDFSDRIRRLLGYNSDAGSSDSYSEADDSDADPNYILPGEKQGSRNSAINNQDSDEPEDDEALLEVDENETEVVNKTSQ